MTRDIPVIFVTVATTKQTAYDATLMDMHMPVMDGLASTRRIPGRMIDSFAETRFGI